MQNKLNKRLVEIRKGKRLTQKRLSELAGISEPTMNHYETGKRTPSAETLLNLASILECDPGWLLTGRGSSTPGKSVAGEPERVEENHDGFVFVPQYDLKSGKKGASIQSTQIVDHLAFKRSWVTQELRTQSDQLLLIRTTGDAMEPTIRSDDLLLVDRSPEKKNEDGIFLLNIHDGLLVRRLERKIDGSLVIRGDNPSSAREETLPKASKHLLDIMGRVVWVGRRI